MGGACSGPRKACCSGRQDLEDRISDLELLWAARVNQALVLLTPGFATETAREALRVRLAVAGVTTIAEGEISGERIARGGLIDRHYGPIATYAVSTRPSTLAIRPEPHEQFQRLFGLSWDDALARGLVLNALDATLHLNLQPADLGAEWDLLVKGETQFKIGPGLYCGKIRDIFVVNGFYMKTRARFTKPGSSVYYIKAEFDATRLSWERFCQDVIGSELMNQAADGSIRHNFASSWRSYGFAAAPTDDDCCVHASASPFEALVERMNWLGVEPSRDPFGKAMLAAGVLEKTVKDWSSDPMVEYEGRRASIFELFEALDSRECLAKATLLAKGQGKEKVPSRRAADRN